MAVINTKLKTKCSICGGELLRSVFTSKRYKSTYTLDCISCNRLIYQGPSATDCDMAVKRESTVGLNATSITNVSKYGVPSHSTGNVKHIAVLIDTCTHCGDKIYLGDSKGTQTPMFKVWCDTCGVIYEGNSMQDTYDAFNKRAKSMQKKTSVQKVPSSNAYEENVLKRKCPNCKSVGPTITPYNTVGGVDLLALRCMGCGNYFGICTDRNTLIGDYDKMTGGKGFLAPEKSPPAPQFTMKVAYETNKSRTSCIACGKPLTLNRIVTPPVMYCPCVENLPKEN